MEVYELFSSDWGNLRLAAPVVNDRTTSGPLSHLEQEIRRLVQNPLPEMGRYLDALPAHHVETLIVKLLLSMGIEGASLGLVRRYGDDGGILISGRWNTTRLTPADVLIRIAYRESSVRAAGVAEMLTGRDTVEHVIIIMPRTWLKNTNKPKPHSDKELVHFVDRVQLLALFMRCGIGCHKKVIEIHSFDQGLWLSDINAASVAHSKFLSEPTCSESSTAKPSRPPAASAPSDAEAAALYWDVHDAPASYSPTTSETCPEWPDTLECIDLDMQGIDAYVASVDDEEIDYVLLNFSGDSDHLNGPEWDEPEWPDIGTPDPIYYDNDPAAFLELEDTYLALESELAQDWDSKYGFSRQEESGPWSEWAFWKWDEIPDEDNGGDGDWHAYSSSRSTKYSPSRPARSPNGTLQIPRGQLRRDGIREADILNDPYDFDFDGDLDAAFGGEESMRMNELDWSDSFDDFDSQDWDDYNGTAEYDDYD